MGALERLVDVWLDSEGFETSLAVEEVVGSRLEIDWRLVVVWLELGRLVCNSLEDDKLPDVSLDTGLDDRIDGLTDCDVGVARLAGVSLGTPLVDERLGRVLVETSVVTTLCDALMKFETVVGRDVCTRLDEIDVCVGSIALVTVLVSGITDDKPEDCDVICEADTEELGPCSREDELMLGLTALLLTDCDDGVNTGLSDDEIELGASADIIGTDVLLFMTVVEDDPGCEPLLWS